ARHVARRPEGRPRLGRALPTTPRPARRLRQPGRPHRREQLSQRGDHPPRRRPAHAPQVAQPPTGEPAVVSRRRRRENTARTEGTRLGPGTYLAATATPTMPPLGTTPAVFSPPRSRA